MEVLFVCWGNINRSQVAAAVFNKLSTQNHALSAGISPRRQGVLVKNEHNNPLVPMRNAGYDLSKSRVQRLTERMVDSASKVVLILDRTYERDTRVLERKSRSGNLGNWENKRRHFVRRIL
ncbi:MAG: hypothetical protein JRN52_05520 [Nitrososphaerota archaeon]|nr:hypothetical protein [Nitrososphaerota archaeon]